MLAMFSTPDAGVAPVGVLEAFVFSFSSFLLCVAIPNVRGLFLLV